MAAACTLRKTQVEAVFYGSRTSPSAVCPKTQSVNGEYNAMNESNASKVMNVQ
jgi:hypothetical protein